MNYAVIARELTGRGVGVTPAAVQRAEWRARVRLDGEVFAPARPDVSTESRSSAGRYVRYLLEELSVLDEGVVDALVEWRRTYNLPVGLWDVPDPHAEPALRLARAPGLRTAVLSHSNGSAPSPLGSLRLTPPLHLRRAPLQGGEEEAHPPVFRPAPSPARPAPP